MESKVQLKCEIYVLERELNLELLCGANNSSQMSVKAVVYCVKDVLL